MQAHSETLFGFRVPLGLLFWAESQCPITDKASTYRSHFRYGQFSGSTFEHPANSALFMGRTLAERIANYLGKCALRARTIEDKECYELASTIVLRAERSESTHDIYRSCFAWKYGSTPEILAEKLAYTREWMLRGSVETTSLVGVPKKPVQSVKALPQSHKQEGAK